MVVTKTWQTQQNKNKNNTNNNKKDWKRLFVVTHQHFFALPSKAEDEKGDTEESCYSMPDQGSGMARNKV